MIIGIGTDIIELSRLNSVLDKHYHSFVHRIYTEHERYTAKKFAHPLSFFGGRWAAKEAIVKALGVSFGRRCGWQDINIENDHRGKPVVFLHGKGAETLKLLGVTRIHVSISHERSMACATAVAEQI